jgi:ABC-2 type transport system permease protein
LGLNWRQQKELLRLRAKLSFRQFMGEKSRLLAAILTIAIATPVVIGLAIATGAGYFLLPGQWPVRLLAVVLISSWLIWSVAPVFTFNVNEGLDPTRLLTYPISQRDFLAHMLLGTLLDYPTYFLLPFAIAIIAGFGLGLSLPVVLIAIFLTYMLMVLTSQLIINTLGGILRSRRFRDISMVVGALLGMNCWLVFTLSQGAIENYLEANAGGLQRFLQSWEPLETMKWLPPGAGAKAIEQATTGAWGGALLWLGYALLWVAILAFLWWRVTNRIVTGQGFVIGRAPAEKVEEKKAVAKKGEAGRSIWSWIPADLRAIVLKDLKLRWRAPQSRIGVVYSYLMPIFATGFLIYYDVTSGAESFPYLAEFVSGAIVLYTAFAYWMNGQNMLGWESTGLSTLFLTPVPRQRLLLGKTLAQVLLNSPPILLGALVALFIAPSLILVSLLPISLAVGLAVLAADILFSVLFPYAVDPESQSGQNPFAGGGGGGCLTGMANSFLMPGVIFFTCVPIVVPLVLALVVGWQWAAVAGALFGLVYGAGLVSVATHVTSELMVSREPEILEATRSKEGVSK